MHVRRCPEFRAGEAARQDHLFAPARLPGAQNIQNRSSSGFDQNTVANRALDDMHRRVGVSGPLLP